MQLHIVINYLRYVDEEDNQTHLHEKRKNIVIK